MYYCFLGTFHSSGYNIGSFAYCSVSRQSVISDIRLLVEVVQTRQLPFLAAAIAYYAFLSVIPLIIVGVTVATAIAGQTLAVELLGALDAFLTPEGANLIEQTLVDGPGRGGVTIVGIGVLLWGSLRVFRGLDIAFSQIYGVPGPKSLPEQLRDALFVFVAIGVAVGATVTISTILPLVGIPIARLSSTITLLFVLIVVFYPMYYVFPGRSVGLREAVPGAVFAGVGWTVLGAGFGIYTANAGAFQLYGVLGGVLLLLVWFYFGGLIILVGAAINVVISSSDRDRQLQQGPLRGLSQRASMTDGPTDNQDDRNGPDKRTSAGPDNHDTAADEGEPHADGTQEPQEGAGTPHEETATPLEEATTPSGRRDPDVSARLTQEDIDELRREIDELEERLDDQTVHRTEIERDLKQYVRSRMRRGHATGWGPYLVLLYGTVMTLGAFVFLGGGWAILAMLVIWLSTLGLYTLMVLVGVTVNAVSIPGRVIDKLRSLR